MLEPIDPLHFRRHLRRTQTCTEDLLWQLIRNRQICNAKFRRQHSIGPYVCDFYCEQAKLDIECDGSDHYTKEGLMYDSYRDNFMKRSGITVLRFENCEIEQNAQTVLQRIAKELGG